MKKILVTGGTGFIGSHIVDSLLELGHSVVIIDNLSNGKTENINPKAKFYQCDITNKKQIEKIICKEKPDIINHHAAQTKVIRSINNPIFDLKNNIIGTINILESIKKLKHFEKIIFASSGGAIYGEEALVPTSEQSPPQPLSPYGISKRSCELYLQSYYKNFGIKYIILRYSNVYGPRQMANGEGGVIAIFCKAIADNNKVKIYGNGKQTRDYIYVEDIVKANIKSLNQLEPAIFNIGTGQETSVNQLFNIISERVKNKKKPEYLPTRQGELLRSCLDIKLAQKQLNLNKTTDIKKGLYKTLEWFQLKTDQRSQ
jgi:UDP-glucose 4-epimerase